MAKTQKHKRLDARFGADRRGLYGHARKARMEESPDEVVANEEHDFHHGCRIVSSLPSHVSGRKGSWSQGLARRTTACEAQEATASTAATPLEPDLPGLAGSSSHGTLMASSNYISPLLPKRTDKNNNRLIPTLQEIARYNKVSSSNHKTKNQDLAFQCDSNVKVLSLTETHNSKNFTCNSLKKMSYWYMSFCS